MHPSSVYLRSTVNSTPESLQTLAAFSPDIIPLSQFEVSAEHLEVTYDHFIAHEVDSKADTLIYIRGKNIKNLNAPDAIVGVRAVTNELILWPQAWEHNSLIGTAVLQPVPGSEVVVGHQPIHYQPSHELDRHDAFVAIPKDLQTSVKYSEKVKNWRDLVKLLGDNPSIAMYNAVVVDPLATHFTLNTRLRLFEDKETSVKLVFTIEAIGTPSTNIEALLSGLGSLPDHSKFSFERARSPLSPSSTDITTTVNVPAGFDGTLTLNIFNEQEQTFGNDSSISLAVYAITSGPQAIEDHVLLGAEHVVFHADVRVKKYLNRMKAKASKRAIKLMGKSSNNTAENNGDGDTYPFYFRTSLISGPHFPRDDSDPLGQSPDIQPLGSSPSSDVTKDLGSAEYMVDVSGLKAVNTMEGASNYVYIRGTTTTTDEISGQIRLFAVPSSVLIHPSQYVDYSINDYDEDGEPFTALRSYSASSVDIPLIIEKPFNHSNPKIPKGFDHYCYIVECKPDGEDEDGDDYEWPHQSSGEFATWDDYATWLRSNPYIAMRNMTYATNPDADSLHFRTSFTIPPKFHKNDQLSFQVRSTNCPKGSQISMDSDHPDIQLSRTTIDSKDQSDGPNFTGMGPGDSCQVSIHWYANGTSIQSGQRIEGQLVRKSKVTSFAAQHFKKSKPGTASAEMTSTVGEDYPNLKTHAAKGPKKIGGTFAQRAVGERHSFKQKYWEEVLIGSDGIECRN